MIFNSPVTMNINILQGPQIMLKWKLIAIALCLWFIAHNLCFGDVVHLIDHYCLDCHDAEMEKGGLNLEALELDFSATGNLSAWEAIHDRVMSGEMPPRDKDQPSPTEKSAFSDWLYPQLIQADKNDIASNGKFKTRRLNRFEFENRIRHVLNAPWLQLADKIPADGSHHHFSKSSEALDISHVQMEKFLETAEYALRVVLSTVAESSSKHKYYAREERAFQGYLRYYWAQSAATRAIVPLIGLTPEPDVIRGTKPVSAGSADPETRERESMGVFSGTYQATTKYDFTRMEIPIDGRYRISMKTYSFRGGPNGRSGGSDHGLSSEDGRAAWWRPDRTVALQGKRSEPITLYSLGPNGDTRWLAQFDTFPEPSVHECEVILRRGDKIRPDATRLVRTRPGWKGNPNAEVDGVPGVAFNWLEIEGPIHESWPPESFTHTFADTAYSVSDGNRVDLELDEKSARKLIGHLRRLINPVFPTESGELEACFGTYQLGIDQGLSPTDALIQCLASMLCSPEFLFINLPGDSNEMQNYRMAERMAYFLWNGPPDDELIQAGLHEKSDLVAQIDRLMEHKNFKRFVDSFIDDWLNLKEINTNTPDAELYPDYYLDDELSESALTETRMFFHHLIKENLPISNLIDSDFAFVNERLAKHYDLPEFEGAVPRLVEIPVNSPRGGLLTQASVLKVTANGTTTSPVIRGAWIAERILGISIPPPPSGVEGIEPDTRGTVTIRQQLDKHTTADSCAACHSRFDPYGFALENFDVTGGWQTHYRAIDPDSGEMPVSGYGKNGHAFKFHHAHIVEPGGRLESGRSFQDVHELKSLLLNHHQRQVAENLLNQLTVFSTGSLPRISDRPAFQAMVDSLEKKGFPIRDLIVSLICSPIFQEKAGGFSSESDRLQ